MIKFLDLAAINNRFRKEIDSRISCIQDLGSYLYGQENENFCRNFATYCGTRHALGVANGLDALRILIKALGFGPGDEIIVPSNTYIATILAVSDCGCTPILVEPNIETYNINPASLEIAITPRTKAIIVVHLYGQAVHMETVWELAQKYQIKIIEDAAQAHGAFYQERRTGNLGDAAAFSFYPSKNLGCMGDGGGITTNDTSLYEKCKIIANYGSHIKYHNIYKGINSRLDEIQAAILDIKLKYLDEDNTKRREIASYYRTHIINKKIHIPQIDNEKEHVWHIFAVRVANRDDFQNYLTQHGIQTNIHYPIPPHKQLAYQEWNYCSYPVSEKIHREIISLPISPIMKEQDVKYIVEVVNDYV